jgi:hypothetical protein
MSEPLSIDAAATMLESAPEAPVEQAVVETPESPPEEVEAPEGEAEQPDSDEQPEGEQEAQPEPDAPAIEPPPFLTADERDAFAKLPREAQDILAKQVKQGQAAASKAIQEAAETRKKADAEFQNVSQVAQALKQFVPQAVETFKSRWDNIDWSAWAEQDPQAAFQGKIQFEAEREQLQQIQSAKQDAERIERQRLIEAETEELKTRAPALADPKDGPKRQQEVASYLMEQGFSKDEISNISAKAAAVAYDAMRFRKAQAGLKSAPPQKPAPKALKPTAPPQGDSQQRSAQVAQNRFAQTGKTEDAIALLLSRTQG